MENVGGVGSLPVPLGAGQVCRTCLVDAADALSWHETVSQHGYTATILDMLVFLGFIGGNEEKEEYPDTVCQSCITKLMIAYQFKLTCADANAILASLPPPQELPIDFDNLTDLEIIQLDHGYDLPFPNFNPEAIDELNLDSEDDHDPERDAQHSTEAKSKKKPRKTKDRQQYSCTLCSRVYSRLSTLRDHLATHTDSRDHLCVTCGKCFYSSALLRQHARSHSSERQHACTFCDKRYNQLQKLKEHVRVAHTKDRHAYVCSDCGKALTSKSSLVAHSKIHNGRRDHKCDHCAKSFTRSGYLRIHQLSHTGEDRQKKFSCPHEHCDRSFFTKHSADVHLAHAHTKKRDFECDLCSKRFATATGCKQHREVHFVTFVTCHICGRTLSSKYAMKRHLRLLHSRNGVFIEAPVVGDKVK